jgi:hypothetical protein
MAGPENYEKYQDFIYLAGSASAEFIADVALCPFEAVKARGAAARRRRGESPRPLQPVVCGLGLLMAAAPGCAPRTRACGRG